MVGGCSSVSGATFPFERSVNCEKCVSERAVRWDKINHFEGKENTKYREMVTRKYDNCVFCESLFKLRFINMERCVHTWTLFVSKWKMFDISYINPNLCPTWMAIQHTEVMLYINWYPSLLLWVFYMLMIDHFKVFSLCFSSQCFFHLGCHKLS